MGGPAGDDWEDSGERAAGGAEGEGVELGADLLDSLLLGDEEEVEQVGHALHSDDDEGQGATSAVLPRRLAVANGPG